MSSWWDNKEEEGEEDEGDDSEYKSYDDHIVFLMDAREDMLQLNTRGEIILVNALKLLLAVLKSKIVASERSTVAAIFFGTKHKSAGSGADQLFTLFNLDTPSAGRIKQVQQLIDNFETFHKTIGSLANEGKGLCPLKEALWLCSQEFNVKSNTHKSNDFKRIWLFTNDDNPNANIPNEQQKIIQVAKDATETGVEISLWHLNNNRRSNPVFNIKQFYNKLLVFDNADADAEAEMEFRVKGAGDEGFDSMLAQMKRTEFKKRRLGSMLFEIDGNGNAVSEGNMAISLFNTIAVAKKPYPTKLFSHSNQPLVTKSSYINGTTGETVDMTTQVRTYIEFGGLRIPVSKDEMSAWKSVSSSSSSSSTVKVEVQEADVEGDVGTKSSLKLLYFTNSSSLKADMNMKSPYFIAPDESSVKGSSLMFTSLLLEMRKRSVIGVGNFTRVMNAPPRLVAIIPQEVPADGEFEEGASGMYLVTLPYASEIRAGGSGRNIPQTAEAVQAATDLVLGLQLGQEGVAQARYTELTNPAMQRFYNVLQAVALNEENFETPSKLTGDGLQVPNAYDPLWPDPNLVLTNAAVIENFKNIVGATESGEVAKKPAAPRKRAAPKDTGDDEAPKKKAPAKKKKADDEDEGAGFDVENWKTRAKNNTLQKENMASLKDVCRSMGLAVGGKKDDLIDRLEDALL